MADLVIIPDECPTCGGVLELTPSGALTCRESGSYHYRLEGALELLRSRGSEPE